MSITRLDHSKARMPAPTDTLIEGAAQAIYEQLREFWTETGALTGPREKRVPLLTWEQLDADHHMRWVHGAKAAYAVFALAGGAKRIEVEDIKPGSRADH